MSHPSQHDCPCCTCGMIEVVWSDRSPYIWPDVEGLVKVIRSWALDHSYDRGSHLPYGLPQKVIDAVNPIVNKHLSAINSNWHEHTIDMNDDQRKVFTEELTVAIKEVVEKE